MRFASFSFHLPGLAGMVLFCAKFALPVLLAGGLVLVFALFQGLSVPGDQEQSEAVKIMFVHVPAAWLAMMIYGLLAFVCALFLLTRAPLLDMAAAAMLAPGALFTFLALATGVLWGKPIWGIWWVWDARLTSVLILFFTYLGLLALRSALADPSRRAQAAAWMALIGAVNLPVVKFSVDWWQSLHQPASLLRSDGIYVDAVYLLPLGLMALAYFLCFIGFFLMELESEVHQRKVEMTGD